MTVLVHGGHIRIGECGTGQWVVPDVPAGLSRRIREPVCKIGGEISGKWDRCARSRAGPAVMADLNDLDFISI